MSQQDEATQEQQDKESRRDDDDDNGGSVVSWRRQTNGYTKLRLGLQSGDALLTPSDALYDLLIDWNKQLQLVTLGANLTNLGFPCGQSFFKSPR
jgi:hypothetical protein